MSGPGGALSGPSHLLLDARTADVDLDGLRTWARSVTADVQAPFTVRSYRFPYALVAWHEAPVGVDLERVERYPSGFAASVCTPTELPRYQGPSGDGESLTALWCGKEALAKALGDALRYDPRRLDSPVHWPDGQAGRWRAAELPAPTGHVAWMCWQVATPSSGSTRPAQPAN